MPGPKKTIGKDILKTGTNKKLLTPDLLNKHPRIPTVPLLNPPILEIFKGKMILHGGVLGNSDNLAGVHGKSKKGYGVMGESEINDGVHGLGKVSGKSGVWGNNEAQDGYGVAGSATNGIGIYGRGKLAGKFEGDVHVTGNISSDGDIFLTNADVAEDFDIIGNDCDAGTVMVLTPNGALEKSSYSYDKKVAGILSGAGNYKPGIILDRQKNDARRMPIAMIGKVYCKADATVPIEAGDLLTTSDIPGHAMKACDPLKAFGTVIGKALQGLDKGTGLIPVLVSLQ